MSLEAATFINGLVATNPLGSDPISSGDDHIRLIKATILNTFPNVTGAVTKTHTQLNNTLDKTGDTMTGALVLSGDPSAALHPATKQYVDGIANTLNANITSAIVAAHPVGSIYMNASSSTNPASLLGFGTWSALGAGRMLIGAGTNSGQTFTVGTTGGSYAPSMPSHTHTINDPGHSHSYQAFTGGSWGHASGATTNDAVTNKSTGSATTGISINATSGGDTTTGNLPPYLTVYMWQRTA